MNTTTKTLIAADTTNGFYIIRNSCTLEEAKQEAKEMSKRYEVIFSTKGVDTIRQAGDLNGGEIMLALLSKKEIKKVAEFFGLKH